MLRTAESDGNFGCCLVYENHHGVMVVPNGDAEHALRYAHWQEALDQSQQHLAEYHESAERNANSDQSLYRLRGFSWHVRRNDG